MKWAAIKNDHGNLWHVVDNAGHWITEEVSAEKANMIAAAPDLFAVATGLVVGIEVAAENGIDLSDYVDLGPAFAAIRKAQGKG